MGASTETRSFAAVLGVRGKVIHWGSLFSFAAALFLSDVAVYLVQGLIHGGVRHFESPPLGLWVQALLAAFLLTASAGAAFRFLQNGPAASAVAALGFVALMIPVRLLFGFAGYSSLVAGGVLFTGFSFVWNFLFLAGLVFCVRSLQPLWMGLAVGAAIGPLLVQLPRSLTLSRTYGYQLSLQGELFNTGFTLMSAAVFAGVLWGLRGLAGVVADESAAKAAAAPVAAPSRAPAPPPLPASDSTVEIDRARLPLFDTLNEFIAAVAARRPAALRIRLADYPETYQEYVGFAGTSASTRLLCAGCKQTFPSSFTLLLVAPDVFSGQQGAQTLRCTACGSGDALFVSDTPAA